MTATFAARELRGWVERQRRLLVPVAYPHRTVDAPRGWTVLETSRSYGIPHLSICGGQGRCSTCRVRVDGPSAHVPEPGRDERTTLARVQAPPGVRLACQLRPTGFNVGGVALVAFRPSNSNQRTPRYGQSIDFVQLADGSVQINGVSGSTPTLGIFFQAAFVLWEDA